MIFRTQDEIKRKLNTMEPPVPEFKREGYVFPQIQQMDMLCNQAFDAGYKQAVKEMKEYFNIKANGVHTRYEE